MTSPTDYNQHLLAYLQAWRQLLEASAAMTSALPLGPTPSGMPPAPPMPFVPPMAPPGTSPVGASPSTDYTQQLFGYLQAWRQYLEQATGAPPAGQPATTTTQPTGSQPAPTQQTGSQPTESQPTGSQPTGSQGSQSSGSQSSGSQSSGSLKAPVVLLPPKDDYGTIADDNFASGFNERPLTGSAFAGKATPAATPSVQAATRSLFSGRAANTPSATGMETGRDHRRAAPAATARWWEAGQGRRPAHKDEPDAKNVMNLPPIQNFGSR
jgi:hypothetical protein